MSPLRNLYCTTFAALIGLAHAACGQRDDAFGIAESSVVPAGHNARLASHTIPAVMSPGERLDVRVVVANAGASSPANDWAANATQLYSTDNRWGFAFDPLAVATPVGGQGVFDFVIAVPSSPSADTSFRAAMFLENEGYFGEPIAITGLRIDAAAQRRWACRMVSSTIPATMAAGETRRVSATLQNSGTGTWASAGLCLYSRDADFGKWGSASTCVPVTQSVAPGGTTTLTFDIRAPAAGGTHTLLRQIFDSRPAGIGLFDGVSNCVSQTITVGAPSGTALASQLISESFPRTMNAGERRAVTVTLRNTGTEAWTGDGNFSLYAQNDPITLWGLTHTPLAANVAPGQDATFTFTIAAPSTTGAYTHAWRLIKFTGAGAGFFGQLISIPVSVGGMATSPPNARLVAETLPRTMAPDERRLVSVTLQNTGGETWTTDGAFALYSLNDPTTLWRLTHTSMPVATPPNGQVTFSFYVQAPSTPGTYAHRWRMIKFVQPNLGYFGDTIDIPVTVGSTGGGNDADFGIRLGPTPGWQGGSDDRLRGIDIDPSGRIVVAGCASEANGGNHALIIRYLPNGQLDTGFGGGDGWIRGVSDGGGQTFSGFSGHFDCHQTVAADAQGRVIVAGRSRYGTALNNNFGDVAVVARYTADGRLDTTFGDNDPATGQRKGYVVGKGSAAGNMPFVGSTQDGSEVWFDVDVDSQGRIITAGGSWSNWVQRTLVARWTPDGRLDTAFNGTGYVVGDNVDGIWFASIWEVWRAVHVDAQDRVLCAGWLATSSSFTERSILARFNVNGQLDTTFNAPDSPGWYLGPDPTRAGGREETFYAVTTDASGRIVTSGFSYDTNRVVHTMTMRFLASGALDTSFNGTGWYVTPAYALGGSGLEAFNGVWVDSMGRVLSAGFTDNAAIGGESTDAALLVRFTPAGALDTSFNPTGVPMAGVISSVTGGQSEFTSGLNDGFTGVITDAQNRIYAVGTTGGRTLVVRYRPDGCIDMPGACRN